DEKSDGASDAQSLCGIALDLENVPVERFQINTPIFTAKPHFPPHLHNSNPVFHTTFNNLWKSHVEKKSPISLYRSGQGQIHL
ncbi:hypothetical protein, partial [uncultured Ruminococcus sp.]|uniref:hypothetical protein n=1 Tax=uncultured Ruminococcus sp. TaxID=165186 RepID=UPI0026340462